MKRIKMTGCHSLQETEKRKKSRIGSSEVHKCDYSDTLVCWMRAQVATLARLKESGQS